MRLLIRKMAQAGEVIGVGGRYGPPATLAPGNPGNPANPGNPDDRPPVPTAAARQVTGVTGGATRGVGNMPSVEA